jgi:arginase
MNSDKRRISILDAPSNLGLKPPVEGKEPGVKWMAEAIRSRDLLQRLGAIDGGKVEAPAYRDFLDPLLGIRNAESIVVFSKALAARILQLLEQNQFPLVLGGDCSILLGSILALRRLGKYGLLFVDGHSDLLTPSDSITGGAAGMDLALATGTGPELLTNIDGQKPYIRPEDTVLFGYRSPGAESNVRPINLMKSFPLAAIRAQGVAESAVQALSYLESAATLGFWLHLDVDVLSPKWMFAVDSLEPGGLTPEELVILLKTVSQSNRCAGMQITIYDPMLDPDGVCGNRIVEILVAAFG